MLFVYLLFIADYSGRVVMAEWLQQRPHGLQSWKYLLSACVHAKSLQSCPVLGGPMDSTRLLCSWDSPGKDTRVGCCALLQGIFPTQGSNLYLLCLNWQVGSLPPAPSGKPFTFWSFTKKKNSGPWFRYSESPHYCCFSINIYKFSAEKGSAFQ